jgi:hypothetical protein
MSQHAVIIRFTYGFESLDALFNLEEQLTSAINKAGVGEFDGNDVAPDLSDGTLYMYGPDADAIFSVIQPILASVPFMNGATVCLRYGPPEEGVRERQVRLDL